MAKLGGTLRVAIYMDPGTIEPATTLGDQSGQLMAATQLNLVKYREDGAPASRLIIPCRAHCQPSQTAARRTRFGSVPACCSTTAAR
jgi:hypothetical protein